MAPLEVSGVISHPKLEDSILTVQTWLSDEQVYDFRLQLSDLRATVMCGEVKVRDQYIVRKRPHRSANVRKRPQTSANVRKRPHRSANVRKRPQWTLHTAENLGVFEAQTSYCAPLTILADWGGNALVTVMPASIISLLSSQLMLSRFRACCSACTIVAFFDFASSMASHAPDFI